MEFAFLFFGFLGLHVVEGPRLGVELKLQLPAYGTVTATPDLSHICDLHHSSPQHQILTPLSQARDQTSILRDTSQRPFYFISLFSATPETYGGSQECPHNHHTMVYSFFFLLFRAAPTAYGGSQARGPIGLVAAGLCRSHSNAGSEPHLRPTPQLPAMPDPSPTERGQGSNPKPHGS